MAFAIRMPKSKIISGKKYVYLNTYKLKSDAQSQVKSMRKEKRWNVRLLKGTGVFGGWVIYYMPKAGWRT